MRVTGVRKERKVTPGWTQLHQIVFRLLSGGKTCWCASCCRSQSLQGNSSCIRSRQVLVSVCVERKMHVCVRWVFPLFNLIQVYFHSISVRNGRDKWMPDKHWCTAMWDRLLIRWYMSLGGTYTLSFTELLVEIKGEMTTSNSRWFIIRVLRCNMKASTEKMVVDRFTSFQEFHLESQIYRHKVGLCRN